MVGIYIQDCENDDVRETCNCAIATDNSIKFPGIRILAGGRLEKDKTVDSYKCISGGFPIIL